MDNAAGALLGLVGLAWILWRQTQVREVRSDRNPRVLLVLAAAGLWQVGSFLDEHAVRPAAIALLAGSLVVSAAFGLLRGRVHPVWREADGRVLRRGNALTVALWIAAVAAHLGIDVYARHVDSAAAGLATASLVLYLVVSLGVQALVVRERAAHLAPALADAGQGSSAKATPDVPVRAAAASVAAPAQWPSR